MPVLWGIYSRLKAVSFIMMTFTVMSVINIKYNDVTIESIQQGTAFCHTFSLSKRTLHQCHPLRHLSNVWWELFY